MGIFGFFLLVIVMAQRNSLPGFKFNTTRVESIHDQHKEINDCLLELKQQLDSGEKGINTPALAKMEKLCKWLELPFDKKLYLPHNFKQKR